jgi:hypothetical protein
MLKQVIRDSEDSAVLQQQLAEVRMRSHQQRVGCSSRQQRAPPGYTYTQIQAGIRIHRHKLLPARVHALQGPMCLVLFISCLQESCFCTSCS